ncbi:MAG TPA: sigma-70 family RNA polymerase sigma factor [Gemmatimonadaceae bacterium]|nr:sigma-70 family RNA polymerase sigma factor [Gemmatimonadaceae bacterium]
MSEIPALLKRLLKTDPPADDAWPAFAREYTKLLLHVARATSKDRDDAMDAYAYLLERLSEDRYRRLRAYTSQSNSKFTTWLVVVARRICVDHHRTKYGRIRNENSVSERDSAGMRRRLEDLYDGPECVDSLPDDASGASLALERAELSEELSAMRESLPAADRLLIALRFDDGLSAAEIATLLHYQSQFHVYRRINTLLAEMKSRLESRGWESAVS